MKRLLTIVLIAGLTTATVGCDGQEADPRESEPHETQVDEDRLAPVDEDADEDEIYDPDDEVVARAKAELRANAPAGVDLDEIRCSSDDDCNSGEECLTNFDICVPDEPTTSEMRDEWAPHNTYYTDVVDHAVIHIDGIVSAADEARIEQAIDDLKTVRNVEVVAGDRISVVYDRQRRHYDDLKAIIDNLGYDAGSVTVSARE